MTPILHLDHPHVQTLRSGYHQDVGGCVWTAGVDPAVKYRHPLTTSHNIGWNVQNSALEFFGPGPHAIRDLSTQRLYGN